MKYSATSFYDRIAFLYPLINYFLKGHRKELISEVNTALYGNLLEIGIGNGCHLPLYGTHKITGIDISEAMLGKAKRFKKENVELLIMNGEQLVFQDCSFDYVVISHVLAVAQNPNKLLDEVHRVLKPGGKLFVLNHFTPDNSLKYIDMVLQPLSSLFHFKSLFYMRDVHRFNKFTLLKQKDLGTFAYIKLLIFRKP